MNFGSSWNHLAGLQCWNPSRRTTCSSQSSLHVWVLGIELGWHTSTCWAISPVLTDSSIDYPGVRGSLRALKSQLTLRRRLPVLSLQELSVETVSLGAFPFYIKKSHLDRWLLREDSCEAPRDWQAGQPRIPVTHCTVLSPSGTQTHGIVTSRPTRSSSLLLQPTEVPSWGW